MQPFEKPKGEQAAEAQVPVLREQLQAHFVFYDTPLSRLPFTYAHLSITQGIKPIFLLLYQYHYMHVCTVLGNACFVCSGVRCNAWVKAAGLSVQGQVLLCWRAMGYVSAYRSCAYAAGFGICTDSSLGAGEASSSA